MVTYAKISPKTVNTRDIAGNAKENEEASPSKSTLTETIIHSLLYTNFWGIHTKEQNHITDFELSSFSKATHQCILLILSVCSYKQVFNNTARFTCLRCTDEQSQGKILPLPVCPMQFHIVHCWDNQRVPANKWESSSWDVSFFLHADSWCVMPFSPMSKGGNVFLFFFCFKSGRW